MSVAAVILAAGASRRMGWPKALVEFEGQTFLDRMIAAVNEVCEPIIVVLGYAAEQVRRGTRLAHRVRFVVNPHPELGQLSSLQCGLRALPAVFEGVLFTPVDFPCVQPATVRQLVEAFRSRSSGIAVVVPSWRGQRGHPVCVDPGVVRELLQLPLQGQARDVIRRYREQTLVVDTNDRGVIYDVDDPLSLEQARSWSAEG